MNEAKSMSTSNEKALRLALEALATLTEGHSIGGKTLGEKAIKALEAALTAHKALAQSRSDVKQEQRSVSEQISAQHVGEPVAEKVYDPEDDTAYIQYFIPHDLIPVGTKFYTTPQQRKPLTDEQIETIRQQPQHHKGEFDYEFNELSFARAIEAAHGIIQTYPEKDKT